MNSRPSYDSETPWRVGLECVCIFGHDANEDRPVISSWEVHRASAARIRLRRLESTSTNRALEAHFTHQTGHRASSHVATLTAKLTPDLAHAIHVKVLLPYTTNLAAELDVALRSRWLAAWVLLSRFLLVIGRRRR